MSRSLADSSLGTDDLIPSFEDGRHR